MDKKNLAQHLEIGDMLAALVMKLDSAGTVDGLDYGSDDTHNMAATPTPYQLVERALYPTLLLLAGRDGDRATEMRTLVQNGHSVTTAWRHLEQQWLIRDAVEHGREVGSAHENFVQAYGQEWDKPLEVPARFATVATYWTGAVGDGRQEYRDEQED